MTEAIQVGPDVNAVLKSDAAPVSGIESNFSDDGSGIIRMTGELPQEEAPKEELILGKFKTQADLEKAYKALEGKLGGQSEPAADAPPADAGPQKMGDGSTEGAETPQGEGDEPPTDGDTTPGIDFEALGTEFAESGALSDDSYANLEKAGISREIADAYMEGHKAIQTLRGQQLYAAAGGEAEFNAMLKWGTDNLPKEQQDAFNNAISTAVISGDFSASTMMIQAVRAQMGNGEPNLINANAGGADAAGAPYASRAEMAADMRDPRYATDPAFQKEVARRVGISEF
jgi:hypothetical protein